MYTYTVMDVGKMLGLTPSALHFYEREGLIEVEKDLSGHRSYHVVDIFRFLSYTKYRSMGFPMKTIVKQFSGNENDRRLIFQRLQKYRDEAAHKADYYRHLAATMDRHIASAARIDDLLDTYEFVQSPPVRFFFDDECGWISKNRRSQILIQKLVKAMPMVRIGVILRSLNPFQASLGFTVIPEEGESLDLPKGLNFLDVPPQSCLHTIVTTGNQFTENPHIVFEKSLEYARSRKFEISGHPWGHILLVEVAPNAALKPFLELWIPIS
jgi:DNA-binding transcriptional MerR regulator